MNPKKIDAPTIEIRALQSGDVYLVIDEFLTMGSVHTFGTGVKYSIGDALTLLEPTGQAPWGYIGHDNRNWLVKCKFFQPPQKEATWSCIPGLIELGYLCLKQ